MYDRSFEKDSLDIFEKLKKYDNINKIEFVNVGSSAIQISNKYNDSTKFLYLFDFCKNFDGEKVLYLSNYSLVTDDIKNLYNTDLSNNSCAGTEYFWSKKILKDVITPNNTAYTTDILLVNVPLWKTKNYEKFLYSGTKLKAYDSLHQFTSIDIINSIIDDCKELDYKYGYTELQGRNLECSTKMSEKHQLFLKHLETPVIIHFCGARPMDKNCMNTYKTLWWKYAENSPIYEFIKEYRELNKYKLKTTSAINSFNYIWLLSRIFPYIKPYWFRILIGFSINVPLGLLDGVTALALKPYMDYVIGGKAFEFSVLNHSFAVTSNFMAYLLPVGIILFAALQGVLRYLNSYLSSWTSQHITNNIKFDLFHRLVHMHPQFFDDNPSGIINSRYIGDAGTASSNVVEKIKTITTSIFGALGLIAVMMYSSWQLAFIGVGVLFIALIPVTLLRKRIREASNQKMVISGNVTTNINETYHGNKVMFAYGLEDRQEEKFKEQVWDAYHVSISLTKRSAWMSPLMYLIASCGIAVVLGIGTYFINTHQMTPGSFASFITSLLLLYKPVKSLGGTLTGFQNIFVAMGRVFELFDLEPQIKDCKNAKECTGLKEKITFENVCFEYVPNKPVLKNINLEVPKGETIAIIGNSGGGKSTLVNLINRFYDVKSGAVKYDGTDIREFSLKSLRKTISMVFQDNFLYSGSIKDNIMMGNPNANTEELEHAISYAHLDDMINNLPEGLDTLIGERGLTLSGGQRQRVAIARAVLRDAPIVILDEATSALDNASEAIVQKAMDNLMKNRTVFIIAHRLSTIKNADRIAVINEGELVELGTHDELMQIENGQYKHLYEMQFREQEDKEKVC